MPRIVERSVAGAIKTSVPRRRQGAPSLLPSWIPPQLCQLVDKAPSGPQWLHEIKLDGFSHFVTSMTAPVASGWSVSPGGTCTHWKAPPSHGAHVEPTLRIALEMSHLSGRGLQGSLGKDRKFPRARSAGATRGTSRKADRAFSGCSRRSVAAAQAEGWRIS